MFYPEDKIPPIIADAMFPMPIKPNLPFFMIRHLTSVLYTIILFSQICKSFREYFCICTNPILQKQKGPDKPVLCFLKIQNRAAG